MWSHTAIPAMIKCITDENKMWSNFKKFRLTIDFYGKRSLIKNLFSRSFRLCVRLKQFGHIGDLRQCDTHFGIILQFLLLFIYMISFCSATHRVFDHVFDCLSTISLSHSCLIKETTMLNANEIRKKPIASNNIINDT